MYMANAWMDHVAAYMAANPGLSRKDALHQARATYTPVAKAAPANPRGKMTRTKVVGQAAKARGVKTTQNKKLVAANPLHAKGSGCKGLPDADCNKHPACNWVAASGKAGAHCSAKRIGAPKPAPGPKKPRGRPRSASPKAKGPCVGVVQPDCNAPCHWVKASARAAAHCAHNPVRAKKAVTSPAAKKRPASPAAPAAKKRRASPAASPAAKKSRGRPRTNPPKAKGPCVGVAQPDCNTPCHWVKGSAKSAAHCAHNPTGRSKKPVKAKAPRSAAQLAAARANIKKAQAAKAAKRAASTGAGYGSRGGRQGLGGALGSLFM